MHVSMWISTRLVGEHLLHWFMSLRGIMVRPRWSITVAAIGAIAAAGTIAIMADRTTIATAIGRADIDSHIGPSMRLLH